VETAGPDGPLSYAHAMTPRTRLLPLLALVGALGLLAGCGGSSAKPAATARPSAFDGAVANPPKPAPALKLTDSTGKQLDIASLRGKAVLVTFLYSHCPDVCPLITGNLHTAVKLLGVNASKVQIVAVSTDPRGDTPKAVNRFLAAHQMTGTMRYLLGSPSQLAKVWNAWGVISRPDAKSPNKVAHSALIYGVSASGKITTLYPSNFGPPQIAHDVPILARQ
jgi:protein SCO1/2